MYGKYKQDPDVWTVEKLATTYGVSQPRVQAILLLQEWEVQEREAGLVTKDDESLEDIVHQAHYNFVSEVEKQYKVNLRSRGQKHQDVARAERGGYLGKFRFLRDEDEVPSMPDAKAPIERDIKLYMEKKARENEVDAEAIRVTTKRHTFVIKDTSGGRV